MKTLFISATGTNIGKTYTAGLLSHYCNQQGIKTLVAKPIETGWVGSSDLVGGNSTPDAIIHLNAAQKAGIDVGLEDVNFYRYGLPASPFVAQMHQPQAPKVDFEFIAKKIMALQKKCDFVIIEGAGGLLVPIGTGDNMFDLAQYLGSHLLLVSSDRLGMLNDLLLNKAFLDSKGFPCTYAINVRDEESYKEISQPYIEYLNAISQKRIHQLQTDMSLIASEVLSFCKI
ncbi:dethiobiotin synthase [Helicobacter sp. 11S02596-1]|uniref:dethiobiotin synthase n=1 Tax=Helicobacter sp. 11S02596-1 TaxID=1476194 RepID=UPI000BA57C03|nr:dethiobiotin synthase [Helicobacter sp. 11S02596-1]PAF44731.1 dethiobiotin synthase [Helicobacter sp. 11S02596-1]